MEFQEITNFLDTNFDHKDLPRFVTKKWMEVYDQSRGNYNVKEIRIKTSMLRADLCDYSDVYIVVKGNITLTGDADANKRNRNVAFKNNTPFINCILKINGVQFDNAEDLDVVMPMYNYLNTVKNTEQRQAACGIITEMNQVILFFLILDHLSTKQILQENQQKITIH